MTHPSTDAAHLVIHLDRFDNLFVRLEQGTNKLFVLDDLNILDDLPTSGFGLVEILLYSRAFKQIFVLSVEMLTGLSHCAIANQAHNSPSSS